jgi:hypothetical protein
MNSIVALPIAAAVPIASPTLACEGDPKAEVARLEQAVELLRTKYICEGWMMDEAGAERALRYFRSGCPDDDEEWAATLAFISSHGLSLDWICDGDVSPMICSLASHSRQATHDKIVDTDPIYAAIGAHREASTAFENCITEHGRLEVELPKERRKSSVDVHGEKIVESDDPRWIQNERDLMALSEAETDAAIKLIDEQPTTFEGALALLRYTVEVERSGREWPAGLVDEDNTNPHALGKDWSFYLHKSILPTLASRISA